MRLSEKLYDSVKDLWESYYTHPFVEGIGNGTLDIDKFRFYMIQDYIYLLDYAKVFALGVVKSSKEEDMRFFSELVYSTLNGEMSIHKKYMKRLGITEDEIKSTKPSLTNTSYTNYMLWVGSNEGLLELVVSILSCSWSYKMIGCKLNEKEGASKHEFYGEWIDGYSSEEYAKSNDSIIEFVDRLGENITEEQEKRLIDIFINCSRYEYMFWDMSFNKEM